MEACKSDVAKQKYKIKSKLFSLRAKDMYLQTHVFFARTEESSRESIEFKNLITLKNQYQHERYLEIKNFDNRSIISKLRLGCHNLLSETSKWSKSSDKCTQCNLNETEDAHHFLFKCKKYKKLRNNFFQLIYFKEAIDMSKINNLTDLYIFFEGASLDSINQLGELANRCFSERENTQYHYLFIF